MLAKKNYEKNDLINYRIEKFNFKFIDEKAKNRINNLILLQNSLSDVEQILYKEIDMNQDLFNKTIINAIYNLLKNIKKTKIKSETITNILFIMNN